MAVGCAGAWAPGGVGAASTGPTEARIEPASSARVASAAAAVINSNDMKKYIDEASLEVDLKNPTEFTAYAKKQDQLTKQWMRTLGLVR